MAWNIVLHAFVIVFGNLKEAQEQFYQTADVESIPLDGDTEMSPRQLKEAKEKYYQTVDAGDIPLEKGSTVTPNSLRQSIPSQ